MKKHQLLVAFLFLSVLVTAQKPKVFIMDAEHLASVKAKANQRNEKAVQSVENVRKNADAFLNTKPMSVVEKAFTPHSGDKHDYMSQAPYFWYDSTKPNGLPYMRKDGERNPEINKITDKKYLGDLESATKALALAYYLTNDEKYAAKAAGLMHHWFFNPETRMNPNLEHAQAIPGINHGRGIGIIESRAFTGIADAAGLLEGSAPWTKDDHKKLQQWYSQFFTWMLDSKNGKDEHAAKNNHGTWYYVQVIDFALFLNDKVKAKQLAEESLLRLDSQLTADGQQPLELERTKALSYSTMNLRGWFEVANLAEQVGVDVWNYKTSKGSGLRKALDWLKPYALNEKSWTHEQIETYNAAEFYPLLLQAARKFKEPAYSANASSISKENNNAIVNLLYNY
jgi:hypothetical protein